MILCVNQCAKSYLRIVHAGFLGFIQRKIILRGIFFVILINLLYIVTTHPEKLPRVAIGLLLYLVALAGILAFGYFVSKKTAQSKI